MEGIARGVDIFYKEHLVATKDTKRLWTQALKLRMEKHPGEIDRILDAMVNAAADGDVTAFKEIRDTMDGKPMQTTELTGKDGADLFADMTTEEIKERLKAVMSDPNVMRTIQ